MNTSEFLRKYRTILSPDQYYEFIEDVRLMVIETQQEFRDDQLAGNFGDNTGDKFLVACHRATQHMRQGD